MHSPSPFYLLLSMALLLTLHSGAVLADTTMTVVPIAQGNVAYPDYYPSGFERVGTVREVNTGKREVVVSGRRYAYQVDLKVHNGDKKFGSAFELKEKQDIGFSYNQDKKGRLTITEIWVLPKDDYKGD